MRRALAAVLVWTAACSAGAPVRGSPSPAATTPSASPRSSVEAASFSSARALAHVRALVAVGPREAAAAAYRRAAAIVGEELAALGYRVSEQRFDVPHGTVDGDRVEAGASLNVVAEPAGFQENEPHLVVGGHLDTVPDSPGANDNASGIGVMLELARLAAAAPPDLPVVFVAFGAEERRRQRPTESFFSLGAQAYIERMGARRRAALAGMLNLDMVGNGGPVIVVGEAGAVVRAVERAAERIDVSTRRMVRIASGFSDHDEFQAAGYPVAWLWAGDHPTLHRPDDDLDVVEGAMLRRVGRLAWETIRALRP